MSEPISEDAHTIVRDSLVWDNHACMPLRPEDASFLPQLLSVHESGVDVISLNIGFGPIPLETHLAMMESIHRWIDNNTDRAALVRSIADIDAARVAGKLAIFFDVEGMAPLDGGGIELVDTFRQGGVGWMLVAYNKNNDCGGGIYDEDRGLTPYGRDVLKAMKTAGMIVCCSHTGHRTAFDVMAHADNPVIFSHSNASALHDHARNIPDGLIKAAAETGGVVGINGLGPFLGANDASAERIAQHIDHIVQMVGPRHVALGLDYVFDQAELMDYLKTMRKTFPDDSSLSETPNMMRPEGIAAIVERLLARGYARADIEAILGGNWRRVAEKVWRA